MNRALDTPFLKRLAIRAANSSEGTLFSWESVPMVALAGLAFLAATQRLTPLLFAALIGLVGVGIRQPKRLLLLTLILTPYTFPMTGKPLEPGEARYGLSDLLALCALPAAGLQVFRSRPRWRIGRVGLPILLFLGVCVVSAALASREVAYRPYLFGLLRTAQVMALLPLVYSLFDWTQDDLRDLLRGLLLSVGVLACAGAFQLLMQGRGQNFLGMVVLGVSKNPLGLALAMGTLIALAALLLEPSDALPALGVPRPALVALVVCGMVALLGTLSRSSYLSFLVGLVALCALLQRWRTFAALLGATALGFALLYSVLSPRSSRYVVSFSPERINIQTRLTNTDRALESFRRHPLLGDGLRTRKDYAPHNIEAEILAETGVVGFGLFLWAQGTMLFVFWRGQSAFQRETVARWFFVAMLISAIVLLMHAHFDPFWRRGPLWIPWAGLGIAAGWRAKAEPGRRNLLFTEEASEPR